MKKKFKVLFAMLFIVGSLTHSKHSEAAVSLATGGTAVVGLAVMGTGAAAGIIGTVIIGSTCSEMGCLAKLFPMAAGAGIVALGLIILDGEQTIEFKTLDKKSASALGVTETERESFNEELDQANMLLADVSVEMSKLENPTAEDSVHAWNQVKDLVSPATFATMQKIASQK
ncbi:MAG: hypothetical protein ACJ76H_03200 [Bacteriovoracaceae bacterium]